MENVRIRDLLRPESRVFLKSEWGPTSDYWPAFSFSKRSVGRKIRTVYVPERDFIIYVGTSNAANTEDAAHRSRLLSMTSIDHREEHKTWELIPKKSWEQAQIGHEDRWLYAFAISDAWDITDLPLAPALVPVAYRQLGNPRNFGSIVEVDSSEKTAILELRLKRVDLKKQPAGLKVEARARYLGAHPSLKAEIYRMASLITQRAGRSHTLTSRWNPTREANPPYETQQMLYDKWEEQKGRCGLCQRLIPMPSANRLLQPSPDRIDSTNISYHRNNVQITHLGCNYAKNQFGIDEFEEWLEVVSGGVFQEYSTE
jgi:hypothetical protein